MSENYEHTLGNLEIYQIALNISDLAWEIYKKLPKNFQIHIGNQFLDAADSIGANISEGYGRFHFRESINFNNYARGSTMETSFWTNRLLKRNLITETEFSELDQLLNTEVAKINAYNNYLRKKAKI